MVIPAAIVLLWTLVSAHAQAPSAEDIERRVLKQRAMQAVIWGMPAVNYELMYQAAARSKAGFNQIVYWSCVPVHWKG